MICTTIASALMACPAQSPLAGAEATAETLRSISILDKVETSIGSLEFFDGVLKDN